jgi:hypothetical protein
LKENSADDMNRISYSTKLGVICHSSLIQIVTETEGVVRIVLKGKITEHIVKALAIGVEIVADGPAFVEKVSSDLEILFAVDYN